MKLQLSDKQFKRIAKRVKGFGAEDMDYDQLEREDEAHAEFTQQEDNPNMGLEEIKDKIRSNIEMGIERMERRKDTSDESYWEGFIRGQQSALEELDLLNQ